MQLARGIVGAVAVFLLIAPNDSLALRVPRNPCSRAQMAAEMGPGEEPVAVLRLLQRAAGAARFDDSLYSRARYVVIERAVDGFCRDCTRTERDSLRARLERKLAHEDTTMLLTEYENPAMSGVIRDLVPAIDRAAESLGYRIPRVKAVGTLPLICLQATTIPLCDTTTALIGVQTGLFDLYLRMTRIAATTIPITREPKGYEADFDPDAMRAELRRHPELGSEYADAVLTYASHSAVFSREFESLDRERGIFAGALLDGMEAFVIAHELAHVVLGHKGGAINLSMANAFGDEILVDTLEVDRRSRADETKADSLGLEFLARAVKEWGGGEVAMLGPDFMFGFLEGIGKSEEKRWGSSSLLTGTDHPSVMDRRAAIRRINRKRKFVTGADIGNSLYTVMREVQATAEPWLSRHKENVEELARLNPCD